MNAKQLLILVVILAVLGGAALMLVKRDSATRLGEGRASGAEILAGLPVGEELAQMIIRQGTNTLTLARVDGVWGVAERGNYPANYADITRAVLKLRDLKPTQTEPVTDAQLARLELLEPGSGSGGGTLIEFRDAAGQPLASLLLGKQLTTTQDAPASQFGPGGPREVPVGRWVMDPDDRTRVLVVSDILSNIQPTAGAWLNKDFFEVQKIKSIEVRYPEDSTNSFAVSRADETGTWALVGLEEDEQLDTAKIASFNSALSSPGFDDVIVGADEAALGLDQPVRITLETFEGFLYKIAAGETTEGKIPMRVTVEGTYPRERAAVDEEDDALKLQRDQEFANTLNTRDDKLKQEQALEPWTFLVSSWTLDSVLKKRGDLVKAREGSEASAASEPIPDAVEGLLDLPPAN